MHVPIAKAMRMRYYNLIDRKHFRFCHSAIFPLVIWAVDIASGLKIFGLQSVEVIAAGPSSRLPPSLIVIVVALHPSTILGHIRTPIAFSVGWWKFNILATFMVDWLIVFSLHVSIDHVHDENLFVFILPAPLQNVKAYNQFVLLETYELKKAHRNKICG